MIENVIECMGCGASLSSEIKFCEYCQRLNPLYKETKLEYDNSTNSNKSIDTEITQESKIIIEKSTSKFSIGIFILLLLLFWPAAIIYLIVKLVK
ncbi:hypothetical protein ACUZ9N_00185 [Mycoplasmopsis gallinarum]